MSILSLLVIFGNKKADREKGVNPADFALTGNYRQDCLSSKICLIAISLASASVKPPSIVQIAIKFRHREPRWLAPWGNVPSSFLLKSLFLLLTSYSFSLFEPVRLLYPKIYHISQNVRLNVYL